MRLAGALTGNDPANLAGLTGEHLELMRTRGALQPFGTDTGRSCTRIGCPAFRRR
jgi:hypothetical protein